MPDNKNDNEGHRRNEDIQRQRQRQENKQNIKRDEGGKAGSKGSAMFEREGKPVGNDNDIDRAFDTSEEVDEDEVTQRNPRMGDRDRQ